MPVEYLKHKEALMKEGKSEVDAQRQAAATYYKRTGTTVKAAHKKDDDIARLRRRDRSVKSHQAAAPKGEVGRGMAAVEGTRKAKRGY